MPKSIRLVRRIAVKRPRRQCGRIPAVARPSAPRIEARLSRDRASLSELVQLGDALTTLGFAASWPSFCLDERPEVVANRASLAHTLSHAQVQFLGVGDRRRHGARFRGDALRVGTLEAALWQRPTRRFDPSHIQRELGPEAESLGLPDLIDKLDRHDGSLLEAEPRIFHDGFARAPTERFFARYFQAEVAPIAGPEYARQLEILDLHRASPPVLRLGLSTTILMAGGAAATGVNPECGIAVILLGLVDATMVIRANLAELRGRPTRARSRQPPKRLSLANTFGSKFIRLLKSS